jgi:uncharacterized membrane protein HdeD (DUF308 family)
MALTGWLLLLGGVVALMWGVASIIRHVAKRSQPQTEASRANAGTRASEASPQHGLAGNRTVQVKEIVAIVGGIVSILVGVLSIIEKVTGSP